MKGVWRSHKNSTPQADLIIPRYHVQGEADAKRVVMKIVQDLLSVHAALIYSFYVTQVFIAAVSLG